MITIATSIALIFSAVFFLGGFFFFVAGHRIKKASTVSKHEYEAARDYSVSETIRMQRKITEVNANLDAIISNTSQPVWMVSPQYSLILANSGFNSLFSSINKIEITSGVDLLNVLKLPESEKSYWKSIYDRGFAGASFREIKVFNFGDEARHYELNIFPIFVDDLVTSLVVMAHDISVYRELIEKLEQTINEKDSLGEQLLQSQKLESIGQLAGGIAHDFNNILTGIIGTAEFAKEKTANEEVVSDMVEIIDSSRRASELVKRLLAFSRKQIFDVIPVSVNEIIADLTKMIRRIISEDIHLELVLTPAMTTIKADTTQIEQVIINLAVNASDAMPAGGLLYISTSLLQLENTLVLENLQVPTGEWVEITVVDNGYGIPPEFIHRIYEPFFTTKPREKGSGLGLSMVYGIIKQHDGYINVSSIQGRGTTFRIFLPVCHEQARKKPSGSWDKINIKDQTDKKVVLIAEDEALVRKVAVRTLKRLGYTVLEAEDGISALDCVSAYRGKIHLLLTDLVMPNMGGPELAQTLSHMIPDIRILFTSGYIESSDIPALEQGKSDFLPKPYTPDQLKFKIQEMLGETTEIVQENSTSA